MCSRSIFAWQGRGLNHLKQVTEDEIDEVNSLILCSTPGHGSAREDRVILRCYG